MFNRPLNRRNCWFWIKTATQQRSGGIVRNACSLWSVRRAHWGCPFVVMAPFPIGHSPFPVFRSQLPTELPKYLSLANLNQSAKYFSHHCSWRGIHRQTRKSIINCVYLHWIISGRCTVGQNQLRKIQTYNNISFQISFHLLSVVSLKTIVSAAMVVLL